jgi:osmotically inducible protein OsmC
MAKIEQSAHAEWHGGLSNGRGVINRPAGESEPEMISWNGRISGERRLAATTPEELIAAAHAGCFSMALSQALEAAGFEPSDLDVEAVCTLDLESLAITSVHLAVQAAVPGLEDARFQELVVQGESSCPVSNALRGNVDITVDAHLTSAAEEAA